MPYGGIPVFQVGGFLWWMDLKVAKPENLPFACFLSCGIAQKYDQFQYISL